MFKQFNKWTVLDDSFRKWVVRCQCGYLALRLKNDIVKGKSKQCQACSYKDKERRAKHSKANKIHGYSDSPTQRSWTEMKRRCLQPHRRGYENYGGRGITICDRWINGENGKSGFHCFLEDMGERPSLNHQLDRLDNDGNYCPENCKWSTREEQMYNRKNTLRFNVDGEILTSKQVIAKFNLTAGALYGRLRSGIKPPELFKPLTNNGIKK